MLAAGCGGDPPGELPFDASSDAPVHDGGDASAHARPDATAEAGDDGGADADASHDSGTKGGDDASDASDGAHHEAGIDAGEPDASDAGDPEDASDADLDGGEPVDASDASDADLDSGNDASDANDVSDASDASDATEDASDANDDASDADARDAACAADSGPSTCGINGRGTTKAVCDDGGWDVTCTDSDECLDGIAQHAACGINARGTSTRTCASGHWGATTCADPDECLDGAQATTVCGINNRGASTRTCASGHWGAATSCVDPDVCTDGAQTSGGSACGLNNRGTMVSTCVSGQWGAAACVDPDTCQDGAQRVFTIGNHPLACGLNGQGKRIGKCVAGKWGPYVCIDPDECTNGATSQVTCGLNNRGSAPRLCASGHWTTKACVDPDVCTDGAQTHGACGLNNRGTSTTTCATGHWGSPTCVDTDECVDGAKSQRACAVDSSGTAQTTCTGGKWQASACVCPAGELYTCGDRCVLSHPRVYVTSKVLACEDGLSWATAYSSLPRALTQVMDHGEVWIAQGVYVTSAASPTFTLDRAVSIYGGFAGTETQTSQRDSAHTTTLQRGADVTAVASQGSSILTIAQPIDVVLDGFSVTDGAAPRGGALSISQGRVTAHNLVLAYNHASIQGGAIYVNGKGTLTIDNSTFDSNQGGAGGGAVSGEGNFDGSTVALVDSTFTTNVAFNGGALEDVQTVQRCTFTGNVAQAGNTGPPGNFPIGGNGGAIDASFTVAISDSVFEQNKATNVGGAISGDATIDRTAFRRNSAGSSGGALSDASAFNLKIRFCDFVENDAPSASALSLGGRHALLSSCTFVGNTATSNAAVSAGDMDLRAVNVLFAKNQGGALSLSGSGTRQIAHATFVDNTSTAAGAGISVWGSSQLEIDNSLFARNTAPSARHVNAGIGSNVVVRGSCLETDGWSGTGDSNIASTPIFESATSYVPSASSPTVDAALLAAVPADVTDDDDDGNVTELLPLDLRRSARVVRVPDMGAYERP